MSEQKHYNIKITVASVGGKCPLENVPGKSFLIERTTPDGMCLSAFNSLNPAIQVLRFGGSFPWDDNPDITYVGCPDHINRVVYKVERIK